MNALDQLAEQLRSRLHVPPGLAVLLVVLVLLYGFGGAIEVLWELAMSLLAAMVGGGDHDAVTGVLWRTLPLALAAAGITFTVTNRWLPLDTATSWVWMAIIVLTAAIVGNAAHEAATSHPTAIVMGSSPPPAVSNSQAEFATQPALAVVPAPSLRELALPANNDSPYELSSQGSDTPRGESAWHRLASINWLGAPDLSRKPERVEPLQVVPKGPGIYGGVGGAINQLLGYLVDYEPRLFFASIIAGGFLGWRVQRKVAIANAVVKGDFSQLSKREIDKLAA